MQTEFPLAEAELRGCQIFWLKDQSLEDSEDLPAPEVIAKEIAENLESALEQFSRIEEELVIK